MKTLVLIPLFTLISFTLSFSSERNEVKIECSCVTNTTQENGTQFIQAAIFFQEIYEENKKEEYQVFSFFKTEANPYILEEDRETESALMQKYCKSRLNEYIQNKRLVCTEIVN